MDVDTYMFIEYIEARDYVTAKKRLKQGNHIREHQRAATFQLPAAPSNSNRNEQSRKVKEEKAQEG